MLDFINERNFISRIETDMPRRRRTNPAESPLARFLSQTLARQRLTIREAAEIAGCAPSVLAAWMKGAFPGAETIHCLKRFCTTYGARLDEVLTGEKAADTPQNLPVLEITASGQLLQQEFFDGLPTSKSSRLPAPTTKTRSRKTH